MRQAVPATMRRRRIPALDARGLGTNHDEILTSDSRFESEKRTTHVVIEPELRTPSRGNAPQQAALTGNRKQRCRRSVARAVEMPPVTARRGQDWFDRAIDCYIVKFERQSSRRRGERVRHRGGGHADRTEIVGMAIVRMTYISCNRLARRWTPPLRQSPPRKPWRRSRGSDQRQPKVYRQRDQRQPCTLPDSVPKPAHSRVIVPRAFSPRSYLSHHFRQL